MKQYQVTLKDKREVFVNADSHKLDGALRVFYKGEKPIEDVLVRENQVVAITISDEDIDSPGFA